MTGADGIVMTGHESARTGADVNNLRSERNVMTGGRTSYRGDTFATPNSVADDADGRAAPIRRNRYDRADAFVITAPTANLSANRNILSQMDRHDGRTE